MNAPLQPASATWAEKASRWWYVLRYHRPSQLAARLANRVRQRAAGLLGIGPRLRLPAGPIRLREEADFRPLLQAKIEGRPADQTTVVAHAVREGRFRLLNQEHRLPDPVDWRVEGVPGASRLWRFSLNYHEFLLDLAAEGRKTNEPAWLDRAWSLVRQWIEANRPEDPRSLIDAWHPYCISRRLPVWCLLCTASPQEGDAGQTVLRSLAAQAEYLRRHLEWDVRGNHLLENAVALVVAGSMVAGPEADRWLQTGEKLLQAELAEQLLPHGEHFERAPMYHARILEIVLDARDAARRVRPELAEFCNRKAADMAAFLEAILHPDGQIPLLGDSCFGETAAPAHLLARAKPVTDERRSQGASASGGTVVGDYWIFRDGADFLILDAGPVGPDHLPAHAHADLLTLEASLAGRRLIVDSGVMGYEDDAMRRYCRSSAAHNVLEVDQRDQCDMWSRFRMGYRGWPSGLRSGQTDGFHWATASHDAYRRAGAPRVVRWIACRPGGPWLCVDRAEGTGRHRLTSRLHFHPEVTVEPAGPRRFRLSIGGKSLDLVILGQGEAVLDESWYCPGFGARAANSCIRWTSDEVLPATCGWCVLPPGLEGEVSLSGEGPTGAVLRWSEKGHEIEFRGLGG